MPVLPCCSVCSANETAIARAIPIDPTTLPGIITRAACLRLIGEARGSKETVTMARKTSTRAARQRDRVARTIYVMFDLCLIIFLLVQSGVYEAQRQRLLNPEGAPTLPMRAHVLSAVG
jgi:hypothetical protein